jgi:outer membrane protein TolC
LINLPPPPKDFSIDEIQLFDTSGYLARCYRESLVNRSDINATNYMIEQSEITINHIKKSIKQDLNLMVGIGYNGIFESTDFGQIYRPLFQNIPGVNYNVGLTLTINPKHDKEKGELVKSMAGKEIVVANRSLLITEMNASIENCLRKVFAFNQIVTNYKRAVNYNKEALENEYTKLKLGTSTIINLVQLQINYNEALSDLYNAILNLNLSLITYRYLTGTLINVNSESFIIVYYNNLFSLPLFK